MCRYGPWGHSFLVNMVMLGEWLDSMITEVFFNLNNSVLQGTIGILRLKGFNCIFIYMHLVKCFKPFETKYIQVVMLLEKIKIN